MTRLDQASELKYHFSDRQRNVSSLVSWFENPPLRPLSVHCVFAVNLDVKEVHRRVAEYAEEAQRVDANLSDLSDRGFTIELRVVQSPTLWLSDHLAECRDEMDA